MDIVSVGSFKAIAILETLNFASKSTGNEYIHENVTACEEAHGNKGYFGFVSWYEENLFRELDRTKEQRRLISGPYVKEEDAIKAAEAALAEVEAEERKRAKNAYSS